MLILLKTRVLLSIILAGVVVLFSSEAEAQSVNASGSFTMSGTQTKYKLNWTLNGSVAGKVKLTMKGNGNSSSEKLKFTCHSFPLFNQYTYEGVVDGLCVLIEINDYHEGADSATIQVIDKMGPGLDDDVAGAEEFDPGIN